MPQTLEFLGKVIAYASGSSFVAYLIFQKLGAGWIDNRFKRALEDHKHDQAIEIHNLRIKIDALLSGTIKIQSIEFSILPKIWKAVNKARIVTGGFLSPLQAYTDLDSLTSGKLNEFLSATKLTEMEKEDILKSERKTETFRTLSFWYRLHDMKLAVNKLNRATDENEIFLTQSLKNDLATLTGHYRKITLDREFKGNSVAEKNLDDSWETFTKIIEPLCLKIGEEIRVQLRSHGSNENETS